MSSPDLLKSLPVEQRDFLLSVGSLAESFDCRLFLIGGVVRDLLLGRRHAEIDVLFEKDGYRIMDAVVEQWQRLFPTFAPPKRLLRFEKYLTGKLIFADDQTFGHSTIDFSSARRETYAGPAVAPKVSAGDLKSDLLRRDFSVNALAIEASPEAFGSLIDHVGGAADLAAGTLRILHDTSFVDDPARLIRGIRFERRLNFRFDAATAGAFADAVDRKLCSLLSPRRLFDELRKLAREQDALDMLRRLDELQLLRQILPHASMPEAISTRGEMGVMASMYAGADQRLLLEDFQRFNLSGVERSAIVQAHAMLREAP